MGQQLEQPLRLYQLGQQQYQVGGWTGTGSNDSFTSVAGRTRTPIMSYTGNGSSYDGNGIWYAQSGSTTPQRSSGRNTRRTEKHPLRVRRVARERGWIEQLVRERGNQIAFVEFAFQQLEQLLPQPLEFLQFPFEKQRFAFRRQLWR